MLKTATFHDHGNKVNRSRILWYLANRGVGVLIRDQGVAALQHGKDQPTFLFLGPYLQFYSPPKLRRMSSPYLNESQKDFDYPLIASGNSQAFAQYCEYFYNPTFKIISRFTGITNPDILSLLTESVFLHLWGNRDDFLNYNSGWLFRTIIQVITRFLKDHGHHERVQKILDLIDNEHILRAIEKHKNGSHEPGNP